MGRVEIHGVSQFKLIINVRGRALGYIDQAMLFFVGLVIHKMTDRRIGNEGHQFVATNIASRTVARHESVKNIPRTY